jgi:hypothetical protein
MTRRLITAMALAVLAVGATLAIGNGRGGTIYGTHVLLNEDAPIFHGRVGSIRTSCERHRKVRIVRFSTRRVIGVTTSNRFGKWKLPRPKAHGRFRARAEQSRVIRPGIICAGGGRSRWVRFG